MTISRTPCLCFCCNSSNSSNSLQHFHRPATLACAATVMSKCVKRYGCAPASSNMRTQQGAERASEVAANISGSPPLLINSSLGAGLALFLSSSLTMSAQPTSAAADSGEQSHKKTSFTSALPPSRSHLLTFDSLPARMAENSFSMTRFERAWVRTKTPVRTSVSAPSDLECCFACTSLEDSQPFESSRSF